MFTLGVPGEITKNLKKLKHAMTESKYKSKGVPTLEITDELSKAVSDMGLIVSDNDGKGNCLFHTLLEQLEIVKKNLNSTWWLKENLSSIPQREPRNGRFCLVSISTIKNCVLYWEIAFPRSAFTIICTIKEYSWPWKSIVI